MRGICGDLLNLRAPFRTEPSTRSSSSMATHPTLPTRYAGLGSMSSISANWWFARRSRIDSADKSSTGCFQSSATSHNGTRTNARSCIRGWGRTSRSGATSLWRPGGRSLHQCHVATSGRTRSATARRSRSMTRGAHRTLGSSCERSRPSQRSIACNERMISSGAMSVVIFTAALTKSGPAPGGQAGVRYNPLSRTEPSAKLPMASIADLIVSTLSRPLNGRFAPRATKHVLDSLKSDHPMSAKSSPLSMTNKCHWSSPLRSAILASTCLHSPDSALASTVPVKLSRDNDHRSSRPIALHESTATLPSSPSRRQTTFPSLIRHSDQSAKPLKSMDAFAGQ